MDEEYSGGVFGPPPQEEIQSPGFWSAFKLNFIFIIIAAAIAFVFLIFGRYVPFPFLGMAGLLWVPIVIAGLPALAVLNFVMVGVQAGKGNKSMAKGYATCGVICLLIYGGCWVVLLSALSGL